MYPAWCMFMAGLACFFVGESEFLHVVLGYTIISGCPGQCLQDFS